MEKSSHNPKEIQLVKRRKSLYARLAYCLRIELKYLAIGSKWAAYYRSEAKRIRQKLRGDLAKKEYPPLVKYYVFYPDGEGWRKSECWSSNPEKSGTITLGMQKLIDHVLKIESPVVIIPAAEMVNVDARVQMNS